LFCLAVTSRCADASAQPEALSFGLAIQFAAAGGIVYQKALKESSNKSIPTEWLTGARHATSMPVLVMHIGRVGMRVLQRFMHVRMSVRLADRILRLVPMLVVFIVYM
jgi:hypothetical protein